MKIMVICIINFTRDYMHTLNVLSENMLEHRIQCAVICGMLILLAWKELIWYKGIFSCTETVCPTYRDATAA